MGSDLITLGLGTPADIPHFVLFGLSPTGPVAVVEFMTATAVGASSSASFAASSATSTFDGAAATATFDATGDLGDH